MKKTLEERFWSKVDVRGEDDCWLWTASCKTAGYPQIGGHDAKGKYTMLDGHRLSWEIANCRVVPSGLHVLHGCESRYPAGDLRYRRCVNPAHLRVGTPHENSQDIIATGRGQHKFSVDHRTLIVVYKMAGRSNQDIANVFGCAPSQVSKICNDRQHVHKPRPYRSRQLG